MAKGRKGAVWPGILLAAIYRADDCDFGEEVRRLLVRGGFIKETEDGTYETC